MLLKKLLTYVYLTVGFISISYLDFYMDWGLFRNYNYNFKRKSNIQDQEKDNINIKDNNESFVSLDNSKSFNNNYIEDT